MAGDASPAENVAPTSRDFTEMSLFERVLV